MVLRTDSSTHVNRKAPARLLLDSDLAALHNSNKRKVDSLQSRTTPDLVTTAVLPRANGTLLPS